MSAFTAVSDRARPVGTLAASRRPRGPGNRPSHRLRALTLVAALGLAAAARGQVADPATPVESVHAVWADGGDEPVSDDVLRLISVRPGDPYRPLAVRQSVKQIFALGRFRDVRVRSAPGEEGGVRLWFVLEPLPRVVAVDFEGAPRAQRAGLGNIVALELASEAPDLTLMREQAEEWLGDQGFLQAEVTVRSLPEGRDLRLVLEVSPGPLSRIVSFVSEGAPPGLEGELRDALRAEAGRVWSRATFDARLPEVEARLRERGFLRATAALDFAPVEPDGVHVILRVAPGPTITLDAEATGLSERVIRNLLDRIRAGGATPDAIESARADMLARLVAEGHHDAQVLVHEVEDPGARDVAVRFRADPGPRYVVGDVIVDGAPDAFGEQIEEATDPFGAGTPFREAEWTAAATRFRQALLRAGHPWAEVNADWEAGVATAEDEAIPMRLRWAVAPGPAVRIRSISFGGDAPFSEGEFLAAVDIGAGDPYSVEAVVAARESLESFLANRGFLEATVTVDAPLSPEEGQTAVSFRITGGDYHTVGEIIVAGLEVTRESIIRDRLPFRSGDPLGQDDLLEIRRRLAAMGTFSEVAVDLLEPEEAVTDRNLLIRVAEGPRTSLGYGAGYGEREQVRGEMEWGRSNLFGRNHSASLFARVSLKGNRVVATYRGAGGPDGGGPIFVTAFREAQDRESLDFIRSGVALQVTRRLFGREVFLRYDFTTSELFDVRIAPNQIDRNYADNLWLSTISASIVTDTRNDPVDPRSGRFGIVDAEWSASVLGSRAPYIKGLAQQYVYFPIAGEVVLAAALRAGGAVTIGADEPALLPITTRFFAGGATTHRGFRLDQAGPVDSGGFPLGGNLLLLGNLEVRFPLFRDLRAAVFSDHGGVYSEVGSFRLPDLNHAVGVGLRYQTPLGPIRFDYGVRLGGIGDGRRGQWHFTIGHAF